MDYTPSQYKQAVRLLGLRAGRGWERYDSAFFTCPLGHVDKTPSLRVTFSKGVWWCFSCKQGGHLNQLSQTLVGESLNELLGLEADMEILSPYANVVEAPREQIPEVSNIRGPMVPWSSSKEAMDYLDFRGILPMVATRANIKYMADGFSGQFPLVKRLMIPVYDDNQRIINWECRDTTFQDRLKCFYPKGATKPLYEWWRLNKDLPLFLLEGLIKTLVARGDAYFANSSTTFGSGINDLQLEQLQEFKNIIVVRDMDSAGSTQYPYLEENWKGNQLQLLEINHPVIKDVDEIPTKLDMTVRDFRLQGGFVFQGILKNEVPH